VAPAEAVEAAEQQEELGRQPGGAGGSTGVEHGAGAATGAGQQQPQACWTGAGAATTAGAGAAQLPTGAARATCT
jgi:hypothetical protein